METENLTHNPNRKELVRVVIKLIRKFKSFQLEDYVQSRRLDNGWRRMWKMIRESSGRGGGVIGGGGRGWEKLGRNVR